MARPAAVRWWQMLGELEQYPMSRYAPNSAQAALLRGGRQAGLADRDFYVADPDS